MNIFYNILAALLCFLFGYIFGSIPTSIWIGKLFFHQDPRDYGSHNAGGTNAGRLWGKKVGLLIIILDMIKTIAPTWIAWAFLTFAKVNNGMALCPSVLNVNNFGFNSAYLIPWHVYWLTAFGCCIGHCFPMFANFKGGKGVSCFMGITIASTWMLGFIPGLTYLLILKLKKYVSLASILVAILDAVVAWIWAILVMCKVIPQNVYWLPMYGINLAAGWLYATVITLMAAILIWRHRANIVRIKNGEESKIKWMK